MPYRKATFYRSVAIDGAKYALRSTSGGSKKGEFDKVGQLSGPKIHERNSTRFGEERVEYFLRAFVGGDGSRLVQAYMYVRYTGEWRFYRDAKISGGEPLRFKSIDTEVVSCGRLYNGCLHSETVGAEIPMETLSSVDGAGLRIYFGTKFSNIGNVVEFSPSYVQGFRAKLLEVSSLKTALK